MKSWAMRSSNLCVSSEQDSLPGYGAGLCVRVVDPFLYGLHQDSPVPERRRTRDNNKKKTELRILDTPG